MRDENILNVEREALAVILQYRKELGMSEKELGEKAFPDAKNPRIKVSALWHGRGKSEDGLRFRLGDFCSICEALGKNPAQELLLIWGKISSK